MNYRKLDSTLELVMTAVRGVERLLGPEDDWVEDDRRILYEAAQRHLGHLHTFVYEKGTEDYVTTVNAPPEAVENVLMTPYQRNLLSSRKYRLDHGGGKQWACGSYVIDGIHGDEYTEQHHVYLFETEEGATDVYAHRETSVTEGAEHLTNSNQRHGDPHILFDLFDKAQMGYHERQI